MSRDVPAAEPSGSFPAQPAASAPPPLTGTQALQVPSPVAGTRSPTTIAVVTLAVVAVLFAMREAKAVVIPLLLAFFIAVVAESPISWLHRKGMPRLLAIVLVVTGMATFVLAGGILIGSSLQELSEQVPAFQQGIRDQLNNFVREKGGSQLGGETADVLDYISPDAAFGLAAGVLTSVRDIFGSAFLILFLTLFMLFEGPSLRAKLKVIGGRRASVSIPEIVRGYLAIKTLTSLATGLLIGVFLAFLGVDYAALWGLLAYLLNYIPSIGSLIASVPAVLLTLMQSGIGMALLVAAGYLVINLAIGNGIEPRIMGEGFGLSTLVVFLSLILWGWLLGPMGMLLSVPLTVTLKIALESRESTRPIAVLLGSGRPPARERRRRAAAGT